jgi:hypothetical protein
LNPKGACQLSDKSFSVLRKLLTPNRRHGGNESGNPCRRGISENIRRRTECRSLAVVKKGDKIGDFTRKEQVVRYDYHRVIFLNQRPYNL